MAPVKPAMQNPLTIRSLVELMGGEIGVTSAPDQGSTFRFAVPLSVDGVLELAEAA